MKFKFHWGISIAIFYILFVLVLVAFVIFTRFNQVDLVDEDYYENELVYQDKINKIQRVNKLERKMSITQVDDKVLLIFPTDNLNKNISGEITFFRPSDKKLDFKLAVNPETDGKQILDATKINKGLWRVKVDWKNGDIAYYNEDILVIK
ncbi:hypothetical protein MASR1M45_08910 [Candidatus Kapaibacterium sp.]